MQKGQLSRVSWPGNSWMPFTFQPALQVLQQPHKQSHSLEVEEGFFKVLHGHIKAPPGHLKGPLATSKGHALLVYSGCRHGKM